MSWSNFTTIGWPTPTSVTLGAGMNDGNAVALGASVFTVEVWSDFLPSGVTADTATSYDVPYASGSLAVHVVLSAERSPFTFVPFAEFVTVTESSVPPAAFTTTGFT